MAQKTNIKYLISINYIKSYIDLYTGQPARVLSIYSAKAKTYANSFTVTDLHAHMVYFYKCKKISKNLECIKSIYMNKNKNSNYDNAIANRCRKVPNSSFYHFNTCQ